MWVRLEKALGAHGVPNRQAEGVGPILAVGVAVVFRVHVCVQHVYLGLDDCRVHLICLSLTASP